MKPIKHSPDVRVVVDADHHLAFATPHKVSHPLVIFKREVHSVSSGLPVRRVHVVEDVRAVVALCALKPGEIFDVGPGQTLPGGRKVFFNTQQVELRVQSLRFRSSGLIPCHRRNGVADRRIGRRAGCRSGFPGGSFFATRKSAVSSRPT